MKYLPHRMLLVLTALICVSADVATDLLMYTFVALYFGLMYIDYRDLFGDKK